MITLLCPHCGAQILRSSENDLRWNWRRTAVKSCYAHYCTQCQRTIKARRLMKVARVTLAECE